MSEEVARQAEPAIDQPVQPSEVSPGNDHAGASTIVRTRVIPAVAGLMLVGIVGLILYAMFAPESARRDTRRQIGNIIVFDDPRPASDFELQPIDGGEPVSLSSMRGKTVLLNFWASWCGPCRDEIPVLVQANRQLPENVVIVGIDTLDERDDALAMMEELQVNYLVLDDNGGASDSVAVEYGLVGVPESYLIDPEGNLVAVLRGEFKTTAEVMEMVALGR